LHDLATDLIERASAPSLVGYSPVFSSELLKLCRWNGKELAVVLNHNLQCMRTPVTVETLPQAREISLEALYGWAVSYWPEAREIPELRWLMVFVPFFTAYPVTQHVLADPPSTRKVDRITQKILNSDWLEKFKCFPEAKAALESREYAPLAKLIHNIKGHSRSGAGKPDGCKCIGSTIRHKLHSILRQLEKLQGTPDDIWKVQTDVKALKTNRIDYRFSGDVARALFEALPLALKRLPTDIQIYNMSTIRDYRKHFLFEYLREKVENPDGEISVDARRELRHIATLAMELRRLEKLKSDWKNNIATAWLGHRKRLMGKKLCGEFEFGPASFDLALDLAPYANPFSFTTYSSYMGQGLYNSEKQQCGYAITPVEKSLKDLTKFINSGEKRFFMYLASLEDPPRLVQYLRSLPVWIRKKIKEIIRTGDLSDDRMRRVFESIQS
jgi:hypothetical protein